MMYHDGILVHNRSLISSLAQLESVEITITTCFGTIFRCNSQWYFPIFPASFTTPTIRRKHFLLTTLWADTKNSSVMIASYNHWEAILSKKTLLLTVQIRIHRLALAVSFTENLQPSI